MKRVVVGFVFGLSLSLVLPAMAAGGVVVTEFDGAKKKAVRDRIVKALEEAGTSVEDAAPAYPGTDASDYAAIAKKHGASAVVTGETVMGKKGWSTQIVVRSGKNGEVVDEFEIKGAWLPGLLKNLDKEVPKKLPGALEQAEPASKAEAPEEKEAEAAPEEEPEPEQDAKEPEEEEEAGSDPEGDEGASDDKGGGKDGPSPLELGAAFRMFSRDLTWNQDVNRNLRPYGLGAAPAGYVHLAWYPVAHFSDGPLKNLGIVGDFEHSFATTSEQEDGGEAYDTKLMAFSAGLKWRFPLGDHEVGVSARYGQQAFTVDGDEDTGAVVATGVPVQRDFFPDITYQFLRPGLDARFTFDSISVGLYAGYRLVLSTGDLESSAWFPAASAMGMDAGIYGEYRVAGGLSAALGFDYRRYGLAMNSKPEDLADNRDVAGGAVDQYFTGWAGLVYRL